MKNASKWSKWLGLGAIIVIGTAGCGGNGDTAASENAVPDSIESPVMDQKDDKAVAGGSADNAAGGNAASKPAAPAASH